MTRGRKTLNPDEPTKRIALRLPASLSQEIEQRWKADGLNNRSEFLREALKRILSDDFNIYKLACRELIELFNKFVKNPTREFFLELLDTIMVEVIDNAIELIENEQVA